MLIEFKFKNFRSFKDETVLSMVASSDKTLIENTYSVRVFGKRRLLQSAVVYGPNAAGKTNLISAAAFVDSFINGSADRKVNTPIEIKPFMFSSDSQLEPSQFEMTFVDNDNVRYQYGFRLNREQILGEWLVAYPKGLPQTWFEREMSKETGMKSEWHFGRNLKGQNNQIAELTRPDVLFLSNAVKLNHSQLSQVQKWFQINLRVVDASEFSFALYAYSASRANIDEDIKKEIIRLLEVTDFGISGFNIKEEAYSDQDFPDDLSSELRNELKKGKHFSVTMNHQTDQKTQVSLPLEEESSGTQRFFSLGGPILEVLQNGWTLFVDELDSSLHPLLVQFLVKLFHNPKTNPKGAQLIFNTHDTTLMDSNLFRRDQIWFVEKDRKGCSHLYSLLEYSPRQGKSLAKGYLQGRYGAIPFLGEFGLGEKDHGEA
jgi:AAA15 family ATPase/GTPase